MRRAALRNMDVLPIVFYAPRWARAYRNRFTSPPKRRSDYVTYLAALVERYGPDGTFWNEHPELPKRPLREWQIWNEPHLSLYWDAPEKGPYGYARNYPLLLRASYNIVKSLDPGAKIVMAGLTQRAWEEIEVLYQHGIKRYFDIAALQIFPQTVKRAVKATRLFRDALRARGDGRKPIYLTEITWPASKGRTEGIKYQRQETPRGMAAKLSQMYKAMVSRRRPLGVGKVFWYTWSSPYGRGGSIFNYAGLQRFDDGSFEPQPALGAYQRSRAPLPGLHEDDHRRLPVASSGVEGAVQLLGGAPPGERGGALAAPRDEAVALDARRPQQGGREGAGVVGVGQQGGAAAGLRQRGAIGRHDRRAGRHRLDAGDAEALVERRHGEDGGARVKRGELLVGHVADPARLSAA